MTTIAIILLFFICDISTLAALAITPYITRKTQSFGISIPEEEYNHPEVKQLRKNYRDRVLLIGGCISVGTLIPALALQSDAAVMAIPFGMLLLIPLMFVFYLGGHKSMKALKEQNRWMMGKSQVVYVDTGFRNQKITASPLWFTLYAVVILATVALGIGLYDKIPQRVPLHWNLSGEADRWAEKSYKIILWGPVVQVFLSLVMGFSYWMIGKSKTVINAEKPEKSSRQNRIFRYRWSVFLIVVGLGMLIMFSIIQFFTYGFLHNTLLMVMLPFIFGGGTVVGAVVLSVTTGQGGSRIEIDEGAKTEGKEGRTVSRDEDRHWKLGMFYYNPDDPAFIVEKRFGVGWTNNWARPASWLIVGGFLAAVAVFIVVSAIVTK